MSPERTTLEKFLKAMPPEEREEILVATLFFYQFCVIRNARAELGDFSDPETFRKLAELPQESELRRNPADSIPEVLKNHPRRGELYPNLEDGQIVAICEQLYQAYAGQEAIDAEDSQGLITRVDPFDFAVRTTSFAIEVNTVMYGAKPLLISQLNPTDTSTVIRVIATALRPDIKGLIPSETPR